MWMQENTLFVSTRGWYVEDSIIFLDDIPGESACYDFVFFEYKAQKFGNNFSANVIRIPDSLESIGYGYSAVEFTRKKIEKYFKKESTLKLDYTVFENASDMFSSSNSIIRADLTIDEFGKIINVTCWDTKDQGTNNYFFGLRKYVC